VIRAARILFLGCGRHLRFVSGRSSSAFAVLAVAWMLALAESIAWDESRSHTEQACCLWGVTMQKVFISYARPNRRDIDQLVEHLGVLGCQTWVDSSLRGGQDWWEEILRQIADCDVFIAIISREALNSVACAREFDWAEALRRRVLPVAVEPLPTALPRRFSMRKRRLWASAPLPAANSSKPSTPRSRPEQLVPVNIGSAF
jgi:TIR domain-containing protein